MKKIIYQAGKSILKPFPEIKLFLKSTYRKFRTSYLRMRYPEGAFIVCNGAKIFCNFSDENYAWYDGDSDFLDYEMETFISLFKLRTPGLILDVGAHWGFYSAFLDNASFAAKVSKIISIEADPLNQNILAKTLAKINRIPVMQINAAVSDKDGYLNLYSGGGSCNQTYYSSNAVFANKVRAISLDRLTQDILKAGEVITHIKLDIDGYEPAFFEGGKKTLKKFNPIILTEFWAQGLKASGIDLKAYWGLLQRNYRVAEACFPERRLDDLSYDKLSYLVDKTTEGITNLVLVPKS